MAEASTAVVIAQTIGIAVGVVGAICLITYSIYKIDQYMCNKRHRHKNKSQKKDEEKLTSNVDYEGIKPKTQDTTVRQRNVKKEEDIQNKRNESKSVTKKDTSEKPSKENEQCHQEVQTVSEQETGTCDFQEFTLPINENRVLSDDNASVLSSTTFGGTLTTCDSLASTETVISDIDQDLLGANIPTWNEMSDADRALCLCQSCEKAVSTITIPCEHPYLCDECAQILLMFYSRCPLCRKHIADYQTI